MEKRKQQNHRHKEKESGTLEIEVLHMAVTTMIHDGVEIEFRAMKSLWL
jgi:hypothetical protein